jgi:hypothetical protein
MKNGILEMGDVVILTSEKDNSSYVIEDVDYEWTVGKVCSRYLHIVTAKKLRKDGGYNPTGKVVRFFCEEREDITIVGKMVRSFHWPRENSYDI